MRKEIFVIIFAGIILGVLVAFGIWRANSAFKPLDTAITQLTTKKDVSPTPGNDILLTVAKPEDYDVILDSKVQVSGITKSQAYVVISGDSEDFVVQSDPSGTFNQEIKLIGGVNQVLIQSFMGSNEAHQMLTLVYSSEFAKDIAGTPEPTQSSTQSADTIRDKVREKLEQVKKSPKAYIGALTDKTQDSLQLKNPEGEIQLVSVNPDEVTFVKTGKTTAAIKYNDVGIGDFVVAMGLKNGNGVLDSKRILITDPLDDPEREIVYGTVTKIDKKTVSVVKKDASVVVLEFGKKWKGPEIKELKEGMPLIAVNENVADKMTVRTLYIIKN